MRSNIDNPLRAEMYHVLVLGIMHELSARHSFTLNARISAGSGAD